MGNQNDGYNEIGKILFRKKYALLSRRRLFENPADIAKTIKDIGYTMNWKPRSIHGRINDVTKEGKKYRTIQDDFKAAIFLAVRHRIKELQVQNEKFEKTILEQLNRAITNRQEKRDEDKSLILKETTPKETRNERAILNRQKLARHFSKKQIELFETDRDVQRTLLSHIGMHFDPS